MSDGANKPQIRPFDWRDLLLVQRLQASGQILDYEGAGVNGVFPLRDALHTYLPLGASKRQTLVLSGEDAFVQYVGIPDSKRVQLVYLAPAPTNDDHAGTWIDLLEQLVATVGAQGVHHIVAEASDAGLEMELLQRIGFGVFTRQRIFRLALSPTATDDDLPPLPGLRLWESKDDWGLRLLYAKTVPQLVQQIEAPADNAFSSPHWGRRLVLERDGEIVAGLAVRQGRVGSALRLLLHPQADVYVEALIRHGLATLTGGPPQPVYCRVRRYESWLQAPLETCGFELMAHTVLLVKHTVGRVMAPEWHRLPVVEGRAEMASPVAQTRLQNLVD